MAKLRLLLRPLGLLVALGVTGAAVAAPAANPNPIPPDPADTQATAPSSASQPAQSPEPQAASSPDQRDVTQQPGTDETVPAQSPEPEAAAASPHQRGAVGETPDAGIAGAAPKIVGLEVRSPVGESLGAVIDVVVDADRQPAYAVISTGNDTATAVPYAVVAPMVKGDKVIIDRTRLENSPQVAQSELNDKANSKWRADADKYWSAGAVRSASPNKPGAPRNR